MTVDAKQQKTINIALVGIGLIGAVVSFLVYLDNKKHAKLRDEVALLDREIKVLDLALKKRVAQENGVA
jgi:energy-converting hydrogenase Eha subunit C